VSWRAIEVKSNGCFLSYVFFHGKIRAVEKSLKFFQQMPMALEMEKGHGGDLDNTAAHNAAGV
jgi:hypothetical protein